VTHVAEPTDDHPEGTRERILEAAGAIARERGYKGTTLARIQKAAHVHPGSFYWHFADKDSLFAGLVTSAYQGTLGTDGEASTVASPNPVLAVLRQITDNPERFGLWRFNVQLMLDSDMADSKTAEVIRGLRADSQRAMTRSWLEPLPREVAEASPGLARRLAETALVAVEGCILARVAGRPVDEELVTMSATMIMDHLVEKACRDAGVATPDFVRDRMERLEREVEGHYGVA
jgi:AcrR family transcriptional regulator